MQIAETRLRQLIFTLLIEGPEQDRQSLIVKYPDSEDKLKMLPIKFVSWLWDRFGDNARYKEALTFEDTIEIVINFARLDRSIADKWKSNEQFKKSVEETIPKRSWSSPNDVVTMTVKEMKTIIDLFQKKKQRFDVQKDDKSFENDKIGKVGPWNIWMPTTRENSCKIVGNDEADGNEKVSWCTATTSQNNPFYKYVAEPNSFILFYLVRDGAKNGRYDFLSLGFYKSKLVTSNQEASITVDGNNIGLSLPKIRSILGSDFDEIMRILNEKVQSLSGVHPAIEKFKDAAKSVNAFEYLLRGLSGQEAVSTKKSIASQTYATEEVLIHLSTDKDEEVRKEAAKNLNMPVEFLAKLSMDPSKSVRAGAAKNKKITSDIINQLSNDVDYYVKYELSQNPKTDSSTLNKLANDENSLVRSGAAGNPKTSPAILVKLLDDESNVVVVSAVKNKKTPVSAIINLLKSQDENRRKLALHSKNLPKDALVNLSEDPSYAVRQEAVHSPSMRSIDLLSLFLNDENPQVRFTANYYIDKLKKKSKDVKVENLLRSLIKKM